MKIQTIALLLSLSTLAACQTTLLSDERIASSTAGALGVPVGEIRITDRRTDGPTNTSYTATTRRGNFRCVINGGSVLSAGIVNPPSCNKL